MEKPTEVIDADAYDPIPTRFLRYNGRDYGVLNVLDLDQKTLLQLKRFDEHLTALKTLEEQNAFVLEMLCKIVPSLDRTTLAAEAPNKLMWLLSRATAPRQDEAAPDPLATGQNASN